MKRAGALLGLAAAYYATGALGLLLAVPPGYATIIWPPSGIAIGALLLFGSHLWPGIFVGSFVLNGVISHAWTLTGGIALPKVLIAAGIATGSTLQAVGVRALVRVAMREPIELSSWKDVSLLLAFCGPIGCVIAATCGVLTLAAGGALIAGTTFHNWVTWWAGDVFGVIVFLPLMLFLPGAPIRLRWRGQGLGSLPVAGLLILLLSLGVTFYAWKMVAHFVYEKNAAQFAALARESETALLHRVESYEHVLLGGVGLFQANGNVTRAQWRTYVDAIDIRGNYPGINGIGWVADVSAGELPRFVAAMQRQGQADFSVHPAGDYPDHFVIGYVEPVEINRAAVGLNIAFENNRYQAAQLARARGEAVITKPIALVQARGGGPGFLMLVPIFDAGLSVARVEQPANGFRGWVYAAFVGESFLKGLTNSQGHALHLEVYDAQDSADGLIYDSNAARGHLRAAFSVSKTLNIAGRRWQVVWRSTAEFEAATRGAEPALVLISGILLTFLLGGILLVLARRAETVQQMVTEKTRQLVENESRYQTLVDGVTDHAIYRLDALGFVRSWNTGAFRLTGYSEEEIAGRHVSCFFNEEERGREEPARILAAAARAGHYTSESWWLRKDGSGFWASFDIHALHNAQGELVGFANVVHDTTQRREVERLKSEFISTVSHELRTPLTSIRGSLGLIEGGVLGKLPEKVESMIRIAHHNSERLVRIINDILDIEKISSGKLQLQPRSVEVASLLREALTANQGYEQKYQVLFALEGAPEQVYVTADPDRLLQIMSNLLSNAAKFSLTGSIVAVRAVAGPQRVRFEVEDHGNGIPEAFWPRVFEKFAQADGSASRRFEGTGLGLNITRGLVESMGGTIGFNSVAGVGTTFYFELPRSESPPRSPTVAAEKAPEPLGFGSSAATLENRPRILHVEDDEDLSNVLAAGLAGGAQLIAAQTLQAARQLLKSQSFSLLVLDPGLPDGNGLDLLEELPRLIDYRLPVAILSVTEVSQDVRQRVDAVLVKSRVSESRIIEVILSILKGTL